MYLLIVSQCVLINFSRFLGSVQVHEFKGNTVLCQAIANVLSLRNNCKLSEISLCSLEIDYRGIQLVDHAQESEVRSLKDCVKDSSTCINYIICLPLLTISLFLLFRNGKQNP